MHTTNESTLPSTHGDRAQQSTGEKRFQIGTVPLDESKKPSRWSTVSVVSGLCVSTFLAALEGTIVTNALPSIARDLHATDVQYAWVGTSYLLATASLMPTWARLSDVLGRKTIILAALVLFLTGSLMAALARNVATMLAGRSVQGLGAGGVNTLVNVCIADLFSPRERGLYFSIFGATWAIAAAVGPVIGGVLADKATWRWCFYLNLPCGAVALGLVAISQNLPKPKTRALSCLLAIDWLGTVLCLSSVVLLLVGLGLGGTLYSWASAPVLVCICLGAFAACLLVFSQRKLARNPIFPGAVFQHRSNIAIFTICFCHGFAYISCGYFLPVYFQIVLRASAIQSGVWLLPIALSITAAAIVTGIVLRRSGKYLWLIRIASAIMTVGFGLFIDFGTSRDWARLILFQVIVGLGLGPLFHGPLIALQNGVAAIDVPSASGMFSFVRMLSSALSVVIGQVAFQGFLRQRLGNVAGGSGISPSSTLSGEFLNKLNDQQAAIVEDLVSQALSRMWIIYCAVAGVALVASFFVKGSTLSSQRQVTDPVTDSV